MSIQKCGALRRIVPGLVPSLAALAIAMPGAAGAGASGYAFGYCGVLENDRTVTVQTRQWAGGGSTDPLEVVEPIWESAPGQAGDEGAWCFASEAGRVRARVVTGTDRDSPLVGKVELYWEKRFTRDIGEPDPEFTINRSWIQIEADPVPELDEAEAKPLLASMSFQVRLYHDGRQYIVFEHDSKMTGQPGQPGFEFEQQTDGDRAILASRTGRQKLHPATAGLDVVEQLGFARFEVPAYTQTVDLDRYGVGFLDEYEIEYVAVAEAGEVPLVESRAIAFIGDPLDDDTGFVLTTTHDEASAPLASCDGEPDPSRFTVAGDGTATDTRTGLMWRRCAVGYTLDDAGTAGDLADDRCLADGGGAESLTWQGALQAAAAETLGGYGDWRTPNVKELETLNEACIAPSAIDPLVFPDTPPRPFWSATPDFGAGAPAPRSWQVEFARGNVVAAARSATALARPVRDTGLAPVPAGPVVQVGDAAVTEGGLGDAARLVFPVRLSRLSASDVSVDYTAVGLDATEGADFTPTAGTLVIPAGARAASIDVPVIGDFDVEGSELLAVEFTNPSAGARLPRSAAVGTILDDEPVLALGGLVEATEADANATVDVTVELDRDADQAVAVDYETRDGTATSGADYLASSGTLVIPAGADRGVVTLVLVGDDVSESNERFELVLSNPAGAALVLAETAITIEVRDDDGAGSYAAMNDTGETGCATATGALLSCPQAGYPAQDAETGRDVTNPDPSDGGLGFSFLKRDAAGDPLLNQAVSYAQTPWDCVEDRVTGLWWEVKTDQPADLRYFDHTYTWYNSTGSNDGGDAGTPNGGACVDGANCDTEKYVAAVNAAGLCGFNDWRLPGPAELYSIAWINNTAIRGIDSSYFPNHFSPPDGRGYWTNAPSVLFPGEAARVRIESAQSASGILMWPKSLTNRLRLVRGGAQLP